VVVTADDVSRGKPHPEPFLTGAAGLGVNASECVIFEDSPSGGRAAVATGATVIAVGDQHWDVEPTARIPDLTSVTVGAADSLGRPGDLVLELRH
jgi:sugar-phosphatase